MKKEAVLKLGIEKALNKVGWDFLDEILLAKSSSHTWRKWITGLICSPNFPIIINSEARGEILATGGHRQGDQLSPFSFH